MILWLVIVLLVIIHIPVGILVVRLVDRFAGVDAQRTGDVETGFWVVAWPLLLVALLLAGVYGGVSALLAKLGRLVKGKSHA